VSRDGVVPRIAALAFAAAALAPGAAGGARPFTPVAALAADGEAKDPDPVGTATKLRDEAKELFRQAGDPDADGPERAKARKAGYKNLKTARNLLDEHLKEHPEDTERLDKLYCDISMMMFWLKKELTLEDMRELQGGDHGGAPTQPTPPTPSSPTPSAPAPSVPTPSAPTPSVPTPAAPSAPAPPKVPTPADGLAEVESYGRNHPGDVPGIYELYNGFLDRFPDTTTAEYARALAARKALEDRMKDVYRLARDEDPEAIRSGSDADLKRRMDQLTADLGAEDAAVRARAAKYLGQLGLPEAAPVLLDVMKRESAGPVFDASVDALAEIGGKRVCEKVVKAAQKDRTLAPAAVSVLSKMLAKGGPAGRLAGSALADYACECPLELQTRALAALKDAGPPGALGLSQALSTMAPEAQLAELIAHVGAMKDPRTAGNLARFLVTNPTGRRRDQAAAARTAIEAMGVPAVRWLIPALDEPTCAVWTAEMLRRLTGAKPKDDKRKTWEAWYRQNRRKLEGR
jgi:HEAT repeat protein